MSKQARADAMADAETLRLVAGVANPYGRGVMRSRLLAAGYAWEAWRQGYTRAELFVKAARAAFRAVPGLR